MFIFFVFIVYPLKQRKFLTVFLFFSFSFLQTMLLKCSFVCKFVFSLKGREKLDGKLFPTSCILFRLTLSLMSSSKKKLKSKRFHEDDRYCLNMWPLLFIFYYLYTVYEKFTQLSPDFVVFGGKKDTQSSKLQSLVICVIS